MNIPLVIFLVALFVVIFCAAHKAFVSKRKRREESRQEHEAITQQVDVREPLRQLFAILTEQFKDVPESLVLTQELRIQSDSIFVDCNVWHATNPWFKENSEGDDQLLAAATQELERLVESARSFAAGVKSLTEARRQCEVIIGQLSEAAQEVVQLTAYERDFTFVEGVLKLFLAALGYSQDPASDPAELIECYREVVPQGKDVPSCKTLFGDALCALQRYEALLTQVRELPLPPKDPREVDIPSSMRPTEQISSLLSGLHRMKQMRVLYSFLELLAHYEGWFGRLQQVVQNYPDEIQKAVERGRNTILPQVEAEKTAYERTIEGLPEGLRQFAEGELKGVFAGLVRLLDEESDPARFISLKCRDLLEEMRIIHCRVREHVKLLWRLSQVGQLEGFVSFVETFPTTLKGPQDPIQWLWKHKFEDRARRLEQEYRELAQALTEDLFNGNIAAAQEKENRLRGIQEEFGRIKFTCEEAGRCPEEHRSMSYLYISWRFRKTGQYSWDWMKRDLTPPGADSIISDDDAFMLLPNGCREAVTKFEVAFCDAVLDPKNRTLLISCAEHMEVLERMSQTWWDMQWRWLQLRSQFGEWSRRIFNLSGSIEGLPTLEDLRPERFEFVQGGGYFQQQVESAQNAWRVRHEEALQRLARPSSACD